MEWLLNLIQEQSAVQAIVVISLVCALGLALGKLKIANVSLGVTFVFFVGILAGHFGFSIDSQVLKYVENFGLVLFVYALGMQVGPGFFSSVAHGGIRLNLIGVGLAIATLLCAILLTFITPSQSP